MADVQIENQLNFLGEEGWELVSVLQQPQEAYPYLCILKRAIPS